MIPSISHNRQEETAESKARWFRSLSCGAHGVPVRCHRSGTGKQSESAGCQGCSTDCPTCSRAFSGMRHVYVVIGGIAAVLHGVPRATFDPDILIEATSDNAQNILDALLEAGLGTATLISAEGLLSNEITVFNDRVRIDVQTSTPGLDFAEAWEQRIEMTYQGQAFYVLSLSDLLASKRAAGRQKDLEDVQMLELGDTGGEV